MKKYKLVHLMLFKYVIVEIRIFLLRFWSSSGLEIKKNNYNLLIAGDIQCRFRFQKC